jgi:hypothetical protein
MSAIERGEGETHYSKNAKCYRWFCKEKPTFRKLIVPFFGFKKCVPCCKKHFISF